MAFVYMYHKYFVVTLKLTNYAENASLISLSASFFMIFRGNSCIEAKYTQTAQRCNGFAKEKYSRHPSYIQLSIFFFSKL